MIHLSDTAVMCGTCRHFFRYVVGQVEGACHARPPVPMITGMNRHPITNAPIPIVNGFWAPTVESETCGEHSPGTAVRRPVATADQVSQALAGIEVEGSA
jgi:hypothetical protein